ncbi:MAG: methyltransferase domain-containing protein, partial [Actinomycetota bacterium]|nr:methyltransferase domain-containing protein [Actinomycetota bacterium]
MRDTNFDGISASFERDIYASSKGYIRLGVLWEDLSSAIPRITRGGLSVLDVGGGAGHVALLMARSGNEVVLCDPSQEMLDKADESVRRADLSGSVTTVRSTVQELKERIDGRFDLVVCHAVLEWLADPEAAVGHLTEFMEPRSGLLSLMFYNREAAFLKRVLRGEFAEALRGRRDGFAPSGWGDGCTPLAEEEVRGWLDGLGLKVRSKAGIRIFHDHLPSGTLDDQQGLRDLLKVEKETRGQEPFASLGQHLHLV